MSLLTILPLAIVMVAGPQLVSAFLLATSDQARRNSLAYLAGVTLATVVGTTLVYVVAALFGLEGGSRKSSTAGPIDYVIIALLVFLMVRVYIKRKETQPPKWMGRLATATPGFSFKLGFLLFLVMPTDVITMITVGTYLVRQDAPLWHAFPFIFLTVLLVAIPLLILLLMGRRAEVILPKTRQWMNTNSWVVSELVIAFFLVVTISGLG
jgi:threonine/homoserine/homoserine lactone efflux protein